MHIELKFDYGIEDVREAVDSLQPKPKGLKPSPRWQVRILWAVAALIIATLLVLQWGDIGVVRRVDLHPPVNDLVFVLAACVCPAVVVLLGKTHAARTNT